MPGSALERKQLELEEACAEAEFLRRTAKDVEALGKSIMMLFPGELKEGERFAAGAERLLAEYAELVQNSVKASGVADKVMRAMMEQEGQAPSEHVHYKLDQERWMKALAAGHEVRRPIPPRIGQTWRCRTGIRRLVRDVAVNDKDPQQVRLGYPPGHVFDEERDYWNGWIYVSELHERWELESDAGCSSLAGTVFER